MCKWLASTFAEHWFKLHQPGTLLPLGWYIFCIYLGMWADILGESVELLPFASLSRGYAYRCGIWASAHGNVMTTRMKFRRILYQLVVLFEWSLVDRKRIVKTHTSHRLEHRYRFICICNWTVYMH